jgi:hypothetical protein
VVSYDGNEFWLVSNLPTGDTTDSGIEYVDSLGESIAIQIGPVGTTGDAIGIAGGQLYAASTNQSSGAPVGIWQVGTGLPTTPTTLGTLPGLQAAYQSAFPNLENPKQLLFFNHNDGTSNNPDTLFIADQSNGLLKFWFDGTNWRLGGGGGRFGQKLVFAGGATGVTGFVVNPGPNAYFQLYVTGSNVQGDNPNQIASFLDTNAYNNGFAPGNFSTLAFVGEVSGSPNGNENFAGLAFVPGYQTSTLLTSSDNPAMEGEQVTFTATVNATTGTPTGVVTFYDGTTLLGTGTLDGNGVATLTISSLTLGDHSITAFYNGDIKDGISTSPVLTQTIFSSGGDASAGLRKTSVDFLLVVPASKTGVVLQSTQGASSMPIAAPRTVDKGPNLSAVGAGSSAAPLAGRATLDAFWWRVGDKGWRALSLWCFDSDEESQITFGP